MSRKSCDDLKTSLVAFWLSSEYTTEMQKYQLGSKNIIRIKVVKDTQEKTFEEIHTTRF